MKKFDSRSVGKIQIIAAIVLFLIPALVSCSPNDGRKYNLPVQELSILKADGSSVSVSAEIAATQEERNYGFMNRKTIPDGTGMIFVFDFDQVLSFWMKDTPHPLSIAYIDSMGVISDLRDMEPFNLNSITSSRSVRFALEVPQGWFAANGVCVGDIVTLSSGDSLRKIK